MIFGVDTHAGYGRVNWALCKLAGVLFAYLKCTTGNDAGVDAQFENSLQGCRDNDIAVGAYHFAFPLPEDPQHSGRSPAEQVERAFEGCHGLGSAPGDLAHVVDAEWPAPEDAAKWGCTRLQISAWLKEYCERATEKWGRKPVIYTYPSWWRWLSQGADVSWASEYLLWFADYDHLEDGVPADSFTPDHMSWVSDTWSDWAICQFSAQGSNAKVPGINACPIDRDCIRSETMLSLLRGLDDRPTVPDITVHPEVPFDPRIDFEDS